MSATDHAAYRPDIDGLRAIAILPVVLFHAFPVRVPGGFIGVDIFFVISGFLISGIIFRGLEAGKFSFGEFYIRRIHRIFPALIAVLSFSLTFAWFALWPHELAKVGKHVLGGAGFASNILLWKEVNYFDTSADLKPLLHLWSLAIEEQFYLAWPLILWMIWRKGINALTVTVALLAISLTHGISRVQVSPTEAFFLPLTRFWELLLGALLAHLTVFKGEALSAFFIYADRLVAPIVYRLRRDTDGALTRDLLSIVGAILICYGIYKLDAKSLFPGLKALIPTCGAAAIIAAGPSALVNRLLLSHPIAIFLGLISYPLYLWHWPLLSFARILEDETPARSIRIAAVLLAFALACFTYFVIERPIRQLRSRLTTLALSFAMVCLGGAGYFAYASSGTTSRLQADPNEYSLRGSYWYLAGTEDCTPLYLPNQDKNSYCRVNGKPIVAVIGDSHATHLFYGFVNSEDRHFRNVISLSAGACPAARGVETRAGCIQYQEATLRALAGLKSIETVVLAGFYMPFSSEDEGARLLKGYSETITELQSQGKRVVFAIDTPSLPFHAQICLRRPLKLSSKDKTSECQPISAQTLAAERAVYQRFVRQLADLHPELEVFDPTPLFCKEGTCDVFRDGRLLFSDDNHLSIYGSSLVVNSLVSSLRPFRPGDTEAMTAPLN